MLDRELAIAEGWARAMEPHLCPGGSITREQARGYANGRAAVAERVDDKHEYGYQLQEHEAGVNVVFFMRSKPTR